MHYKIVTVNKFNIDMNPSLNESQFTRFVKTLSAINCCFYKASLMRLLWRMCILLFIIFIQIQIFLSGTSSRHGGLCHNSPDKTGAMCSISNISNWCHSGQILELCQNNFWKYLCQLASETCSDFDFNFCEGNEVDQRYRGNVDRKFHNSRMSTRSGATQEGTWTIPSCYWGMLTKCRLYNISIQWCFNKYSTCIFF